METINSALLFCAVSVFLTWFIMLLFANITILLDVSLGEKE